MSKPPSKVRSLIVCDPIITDRITGKQSLIGMFNHLDALGAPVAHPQLRVFVALAGRHGQAEWTSERSGLFARASA